MKYLRMLQHLVNTIYEISSIDDACVDAITAIELNSMHEVVDINISFKRWCSDALSSSASVC